MITCSYQAVCYEGGFIPEAVTTREAGTRPVDTMGHRIIG